MRIKGTDSSPVDSGGTRAVERVRRSTAASPANTPAQSGADSVHITDSARQLAGLQQAIDETAGYRYAARRDAAAVDRPRAVSRRRRTHCRQAAAARRRTGRRAASRPDMAAADGVRPADVRAHRTHPGRGSSPARQPRAAAAQRSRDPARRRRRRRSSASAPRGTSASMRSRASRPSGARPAACSPAAAAARASRSCSTGAIPARSLRARWLANLDCARRCKDHNDRNGAVVTARLNHVQQLLAQLRGASPPSTYGPGRRPAPPCSAAATSAAPRASSSSAAPLQACRCHERCQGLRWRLRSRHWEHRHVRHAADDPARHHRGPHRIPARFEHRVTC